MSPAKLSDREVHERLVAATDMLSGAEGQSAAGDTALATARKALVGLQFAMVALMDRDAGEATPAPSGAPSRP